MLRSHYLRVFLSYADMTYLILAQICCQAFSWMLSKEQTVGLSEFKKKGIPAVANVMNGKTVKAL